VSVPASPPRPLVLVCEDGDESRERFCRFFADEFTFLRVQDHASTLAACAQHPIGILCDMDFHRLPPDRLVDEAGATGLARGPDDVRRMAEMQGALILRALRSAGVTTPALLFVDLDDPARVRFLERTLAPLVVIASGEGLSAIGARLRAWAPAQ
jgi:CheY-like chemotaxis protein